jgi:hypothetical protein
MRSLVPLNCTSVAFGKSEPVIVTDVPTGPLVGEKLKISGRTVKFSALVAIASGVRTLIGPVVAPEGTVAVICVSESIEKVDALVSLNWTSEAFVKSVPVMTTEVPTGPSVGLNPVTEGVWAWAGKAVVAVRAIAIPTASTSARLITLSDFPPARP